MKLPWDRNYLKISFHVIFTLIVVYVLVVAVNGASWVVTNFSELTDALGKIFGQIFSVFSVLVSAFVIAYLFDPLAGFYQRKFEEFYDKRVREFIENRNIFKKWALRRDIKAEKDEKYRKKLLQKRAKRTAGAIFTYLTVAIVLFLVGFFMFRSVGKNNFNPTEIVNSVADRISQTSAQLTEFIGGATDKLTEWGFADFATDVVASGVNSVAKLLQGISVDIVSMIAKTGTFIANFVIALVVAFYFLRDKAAITRISGETVDLFLPARFGGWLKTAAGEVNDVFSGYIRGQLLDGMIMAVLIWGALSVIGVDFALIIGIISGFSNLIPYFGAIVGFVLSILVALLSGEPQKAVYAGIAILVLQQLDGMFIVPKIVGERVELSPALVLLSLGIFGSLFGFLGLLFAVPFTAIIKIFLTREFNRRKRNRESARVAEE